jgi:O-antigen/teichoic acid export membrane protein
LGGAAALRALTNFAMPVLQSISALNLLLLPALVRDRQSGGTRRMGGTIRFYLAVFSGGSLAYMLALWVLREQAFALFYGGKYAEYSGWPFLLAALLPAGTCISAVLGDALRAMERPDCVFRAYIGSAVAAAGVGIPLTAFWGVTGALLGIHLSSAALISALWFYWRSGREQERSAP